MSGLHVKPGMRCFRRGFVLLVEPRCQCGQLRNCGEESRHVKCRSSDRERGEVFLCHTGDISDVFDLVPVSSFGHTGELKIGFQPDQKAERGKCSNQRKRVHHW
ncbi:hypothetical protein AVEN_87599-1 [Araneus ventricosus]|uniref:Uncharacterized protein n=1 Tax=Araneus ventricosus TaxID=182803 RepID=A0A4Y2LSY7_ARAVE|nr:hypothetical protein AVEN_87599-1 [Araneus ventricosus]